MPKMIDMQALLADIEKEIEYFSSSPGNHSYFDYAKKNGLIIARHIIERQHKIEAEPVRHEKWEDLGKGHGMRCTGCKRRIRYKNGMRNSATKGYYEHCHGNSAKGYYEYCPGCGARMDGEQNG